VHPFHGSIVKAKRVASKEACDRAEQEHRREPTQPVERAARDWRHFARRLIRVGRVVGEFHHPASRYQTARASHAAIGWLANFGQREGVSDSTVASWLSRIDKDTKEKRNNRIFDKWLACWTLDEIAESEGLDKATVSRVCCDFPELEKCNKPQRAAAEHATDFTPPIYNIWKQQEKTSGSSHFGNSEVRWLDNLLYLYTSPFDVVVDPFAGGGSTIDICKKRLRRYFVSDRKPIVEREKEIRTHDLTSGLPKPPQWKDVKLVYLDPPYWKQAEGQYSNDPTDLANMPLDEFNKSLAGIIGDFAKKLSGAYVALIIQPTQWKSPNREFVDHVGDMLRAVKLPVEMRYSVPYESQQCNAQMVEWAKDAKQCLVLTREIVVWRVQ
jgi:hypothetical protein